MRKSGYGFTIVEIVVVVVVIGILATIGIFSFSQVQSQARDSQRVSQLSAVSEALEKYYQANGEYPSCEQMEQSASSIKSNVLTGIDVSILKSPSNHTTDNSITSCVALTTSSGDVFAYVGDGSQTCLSGSSCLSYTLQYREEASNTIKSIYSRHKTDFATSGASVLNATPSGLGKISLDWTAIDNAATYTVERLSGAACTGTTDASYTSLTGVSYDITGLNNSTTYYLRIKGVTGDGGSSAWSNCETVTTQDLSGINIIATANSNSQITLTWTKDDLASSGYNIDWSTHSNFSDFVGQETGIDKNITSKVITGLSTGVTYYFRGQSVAGVTHGPWAYANATTFVPAPTSITATANTTTQITADWSDVAVADTYKLQYSADATFATGVSTFSGLTSSSKVVTGLNQGKTYYFRAYALVGVTSSVASPTASATTGVDTPSSPGVGADQPGSVRTCAAGDWVKYPAMCPNNYYATGWITSTSCPTGTSPVYIIGFRYSPSPLTEYYTSATTTSQWYSEAAKSGYVSQWRAKYYCDGPNSDSGWSSYSGWVDGN